MIALHWIIIHFQQAYHSGKRCKIIVVCHLSRIVFHHISDSSIRVVVKKVVKSINMVSVSSPCGLLLYSTLGEPNEDQNCLQLGSLPLGYRWGDVRARSQGLLCKKGETCFVWTGDDWAAVNDDSTKMPPGQIIRVKLLPDTGPRFALKVSYLTLAFRS